MTQLIIKIVLMLGIVLGISNYLLYLKTGKMPFNMETLFGNNGQGIELSAPSIPELINNSSNPVKEEVYKWVDEKGVTHFSKQKPDSGQDAESIELGSNINIVDAVKVKPKAETVATKVNTENFNYHPKNVKKLIDDAQNVEKLIKDRYDQQQKIIDSR